MFEGGQMHPLLRITELTSYTQVTAKEIKHLDTCTVLGAMKAQIQIPTPPPPNCSLSYSPQLQSGAVIVSTT